MDVGVTVYQFVVYHKKMIAALISMGYGIRVVACSCRTPFIIYFDRPLLFRCATDHRGFSLLIVR